MRGGNLIHIKMWEMRMVFTTCDIHNDNDHRVHTYHISLKSLILLQKTLCYVTKKFTCFIVSLNFSLLLSQQSIPSRACQELKFCTPLTSFMVYSWVILISQRFIRFRVHRSVVAHKSGIPSKTQFPWNPSSTSTCPA